MIKLRVLFTLFLGMPILANAQDFTSKHTQELVVRVLSDDNGVIKEEKGIFCTPQTCCFKEEFYCFMERGRCICDIYSCKEDKNQKEYWLEISGTLAATYCRQPRLLHEYTGLCLCDPDQDPVCTGECDPPADEICAAPTYPPHESALWRLITKWTSGY